MGDLLEHYFTNNTHLECDIRKINYENKGVVFAFFSDNGVFSKNHIDFGSSLLVNTILKNEKVNKTTILDVGCGYGFMGITLAKLLDSYALMADVNKRALHLANRNIKENNVNAETIESNAYDKVEGKFELIVSNPPIRAGKDVCLNFIRGAKDYLEQNGRLWLVIRKDKGAKSFIKNIEDIYNVEVVEREKGFFIIRAVLR